MYQQSTEFYDAIYRELKDYGKEADKLHYLLQNLPSPPHSLLDVGCGTGEHAKQLSNRFGYSVDGIDIQAGFVSIAQAKLPDSRFRVGDMRDFHLSCQYDAILCLFSSIGYAETYSGLLGAIASFARHLKPGGWVICEPWVFKDNWIPGLVDSVTAQLEHPPTSILRTRYGESDGDVSVLRIDYEVERQEMTTHFSEVHRLGLFTRSDYEAAFRDANFQVRWLPQGLQNQSMIVAQFLPST